jgi:hypothetical protein
MRTMKNPIDVPVFHLPSSADPSTGVPGNLRVDPFGVHFRPDEASAADIMLDVARITAVNLSTLPGAATAGRMSIAIDTPDRRFRFVLAEAQAGASDKVVSAAREAVAAQFGASSELTVGDLPAPARRTRGARGPHVILGVSDVSGAPAGGPRTLLIQVSAPGTAYAWKRTVVLAADVHEHLRTSFDGLPRTAWSTRRLRMNELGALLLHNTVTARAAEEVRRLSPGVVTLQIDDLLAHLPWGVLHDGASYPLLGTAVSQQIVTLDPPPPPRRRGDRRRALLLANPTGDLPATEAETSALADWFRKAARSWEVDSWTGAKVSRVRLLSALASGRYEIVHYAGHSVFAADAPEKSVWRLSDGELTAIELQQNVEANPPGLVYASSCEGGREGEREAMSYHRRMFGLVSAFLLGGVRNYLGFYWPIPDVGAAELAVAFYGALLVQGKPVAESLRIARQKMSTQPGNPLLWGGATLFGDPMTRMRGAGRRA